MIFVIADDHILSIYNSERELQGACEGIDVEDGVYKFFGSKGEELIPSFYKPNEQGKMFGILGWVVSGKYSLVPAPEKSNQTLLQALNEVVGIDKNQWFKNVSEVQKFLTTACN